MNFKETYQKSGTALFLIDKSQSSDNVDKLLKQKQNKFRYKLSNGLFTMRSATAILTTRTE